MANWIQKAHLHKGAFTAFAKAHDMGVQEAADAVTSGRVKASARRKKEAVLAKTFRAMAAAR